MYVVYLVFLVCFSDRKKNIYSLYRQNHHRYPKEHEITMHIVYDVILMLYMLARQ